MNTLSNIVKLSKKFIAVASTSDNLDNKKKVLHIAREELQAYFPIEEFESQGIPSLLVHNTTDKRRHFSVILNAHLDVVSGNKQQFQPVEKDGKLYGRGAYDMKAAASVMILLFKELANRISLPLALQLVTDEEISGRNGTDYQIKKGVKGDFIIVGEGTNFKIINKCKGRINLHITTYGKGAHGAYVWKGENAIREMLEIIERLEAMYPTPTQEAWITTINLAKMETTNEAFNQIPVDCTAWLDVRYIPEESTTIMEKISSVIPPDAKLEIIAASHPHRTNENNSFIVSLQKTATDVANKQLTLASAHGGSDLNFFTDIGIAGIEFGPGGSGHHSDEEWVDIQSLHDYYTILKSFLLSLS